MGGYNKLILYSVSIINGTFFLVGGVLEARGVLTPLITATVLSLVIVPMALWMEQRITRGLASLISTLTLFIIALGFVALLFIPSQSFVDSWPEIKETMQPKIEQLKTFVIETVIYVTYVQWTVTLLVMW